MTKQLFAHCVTNTGFQNTQVENHDMEPLIKRYPGLLVVNFWNASSQTPETGDLVDPDSYPVETVYVGDTLITPDNIGTLPTRQMRERAGQLLLNPNLGVLHIPQLDSVMALYKGPDYRAVDLTGRTLWPEMTPPAA